jgi:hypothetical protein
MKRLFLLAVIVATVHFSFAQSDANEVTKEVSLGNALKELSSGSNTFVSFSAKEDTKGSRYFFGSWVKGSVKDMTDNSYSDPGYFYNYDKISYQLFVTANKKDVIELDADKVKSFTLNNNGVQYNFERIPSIEPVAFLQVLAKNSAGYSAYKLTNTQFEKANYSTDGMVETGKNYDEYVDAAQYYIGLGNSKYVKVDLTKKALKKTLAQDPKAEVFFSQHKDGVVDEDYLKDLVNFLNKDLEKASNAENTGPAKTKI